MIQRTHLFTVNRLRWAISIALLTHSLPGVSDGLVPAAGPAGQPLLSDHQGLPSVAIVAPDPSGISDNHFSDFNVASQGLVINNSLHAGHAQLGADLQANPLLQGRAADTIVMNVIGQSSSRIEGVQEIFGQRADYLLANPNGIFLNGASFINANRASFLVGIPELENGRIVRLSASHEQALLQVGPGGASNAEGALELITPTLDTQGALTARDSLDVMLGHNTFNFSDRALLHTAPSTAAPIDAQLLGAMRAGRIRILSTTEGAGVKMPKTQLAGRDGVQVQARGDLHLSGSTSANGAVIAQDGDVTLHSDGDLRLTAVDIQAKNIHAKADKALRMDTLTRERITRDHEQRHHKAWFIPTEEYSRRTTQTTRQQLASRMEASQDIRLEAGGEMHLTAATVKAGKELTVDTGGSLTITAAKDSNEVFETLRHRKHLWRGDRNTLTNTETARGSELTAGTLQVNSQGDVNIRGSRLHAEDDGLLRTAGKATIDSVQVNTSLDNNDFRGDLVGGYFFGKTVDDTRKTGSQQGSEIRSQSNLRLEVTDKATLIGSKASAAGEVVINSKNAIELRPAVETREQTTTTQTRGFVAKAGETKAAADGKDGSKQYYAQAGYAVQTDNQQRSSKSNVATELSGNVVKVGSDTQVLAKGAKVSSESRTELTAPRIDVLASQSQASSSDTQTLTDFNLRVTGGMDRAGSAYVGGRETSTQESHSTTHTPSTFTSNGNQTFIGNTLTNQGSSITSAGITQLDVETARQEAVHDLDEQRQAKISTRAMLGATLEYTDLTRPIEKAVKGEEQSRHQQQALEDNLFAPSVGADLIVEHQQRATATQGETAVVPTVTGAQVNVAVNQELVDIGTQYTATAGRVQINAGKHDQQATYNRSTNTLNRLDADTRARLDTNTGADINAKIVGSGGSIDQASKTLTAVPSLMAGRDGIAVQLGSDGRYEGSRISSQNGNIGFTAGGNLEFPASIDRQTRDERTIDGSAWVKGGNSPVPGKSIGGSAIGKYQNSASEDSQARPAAFDTPAVVSVMAGKAVAMVAPRIGSESQPVTSIELQAGGRTLIDTASDTHTASGQTYGGGVQASISGSGKAGGLGASLQLGQVDENRTSATGGEWHARGEARVVSGAGGDTAIHLKGLNVDAATLALQATKGGVAVLGAESVEQRNNKAAAVGLSVNGANTTEAAKGYGAVHGRATLNLDKLDSTTHANSQIKVASLDLNTRGDTAFSSSKVDAERIGGTIAGDLRVSSQQDQVSGYKVDLDARLNAEKNPQGLLNGVGALAGPAAGKVKEQVGGALKKVDPGFAPTLHLDVSKTQRNTATAQTVLSGREGIALTVEGDTQLNGALLRSSKGAVDLGGSTVNTSSHSGSDHLFGLEGKLSLVPEEMTQNLINAFTGTPDRTDQTSDLGLIRTKGHDRQQTLKGEIKHKEG